MSAKCSIFFPLVKVYLCHFYVEQVVYEAYQNFRLKQLPIAAINIDINCQNKPQKRFISRSIISTTLDCFEHFGGT